MQVTTTSLALKRLAFLVASAVITAILAWGTGEYANAAWFPMVYFALTTVRDILDKNIPNR